MKLLKHISLACLVAVIAASCTKEVADNPMEAGAVAITIDIPQISASRASEAGVGDENHIKELKLFFFDATTGVLDMVIPIDPTQSEIGNFSWDNTSRRLTMPDFEQPERERTVYAVANWTIASAELADITTVAKLQAALTTIAAPIATPTKELPLVMSGKANNTFSTQKAMSIKVNRQVVKFEITVTLDQRFTDAFPAYVFDQGTIELRNAPNSSFVCEQTAPALPSGNAMFSYGPQALPATRSMTLYAYENPTSGINNPQATYLILKMPYAATAGGAKTENNYYQLNIANQTDVANPTRTLRNTLYRMKVSVEGFGSDTPNPNAVQVTTTVLPWDAEDVTSSDGEFIKLDKESLTLKFTAPQEIKVAAHDLAKVNVVSKNKKVDFTYTAGTLTVNTKYDEANSEFITDLDQLTLTIGGQTKIVKINYEPSMAQRFARGMLVWNGSKVVIGAPDADPWMNLVFKFGRPIAMLPTSTTNGSDYKIVYDPTVWMSGIPGDPSSTPHTELDTYFNPSIEPRLAAYYGADKDYIVHGLEPNGLDKGRTGGDICRIISPDTEGHCWRIPMQSEWIQLLGKKGIPGDGTTSGKAIPMSSHPLQGSTGNPDLKFGWFVGPTAQAQTAANVGNPGKGSVFLYAHNYGTANGLRTAYERRGTINIMSSSLENPAIQPSLVDPVLYATANGVEFGHGPQNAWVHAFPVRCIRDYEREKTLPKR